MENENSSNIHLFMFYFLISVTAAGVSDILMGACMVVHWHYPGCH
jgi:hypothetical protein